MSYSMGLDWGASTHAVCVFDDRRRRAAQSCLDCPLSAADLTELSAG